MPTIETIARPRKNRISIAVPEEYGACPFQVILVPIVDERRGQSLPDRRSRKERTFVDALLDCPKFEDGESFAEDLRSLEVPSAFDRAGCFDTEDFI